MKKLITPFLFLICLTSISTCMSPIDGKVTTDMSTVLTLTLTAAVSDEYMITTIGTEISLDGSSSSDANGNTLSYQWGVFSAPDGSISTINDANSSIAKFNPDATGDYILSLVVSDGTNTSSAEYISLLAKSNNTPIASTTSGVAPLSVFFDAGFVDYESFHNISYSWDFGDATDDLWIIADDTQDTSKNYASGPLAGHVFESPGTYTVTLIKRGLSGDTIETVNINVKDPDTFYSGTNTKCFSSIGNFTDCPAGADPVTSSDLSEMEDYIGDDTRILLRRGDSWTLTEYISVDKSNMTIGAFGTCTSPDSRGFCENAPQIQITDDNLSFLVVDNSTGLRFQDIEVSGPVTSNVKGKIVSGSQNIQDLLVLRLKGDGFYSGIVISYYNTHDHRRLSIIDCELTNSLYWGMFIGARQLQIMGNHVHDIGSHGIRIWQSNHGVVNHNTVYSATKHSLKFHAPAESQISITSDTMLNHRSEFNLISSNTFGWAPYSWSVTIGPQNDFIDQRIKDIIIEKNRFFSGYNKTGAAVDSGQLVVWGRKITIRNNIIDGNGSANYFSGIKVDRRGVEPDPKKIRVYNNTIYKTDYLSTNDLYVGIDVRNATDVEVINNLVQLPPISGVTMLNCGSDCITSNNILTDNPDFIDASTDYLLKNFGLFSTSPAINQGIEVPAFDDFQGNPRPYNSAGTYDVGAFEY